MIFSVGFLSSSGLQEGSSKKKWYLPFALLLKNQERDSLPAGHSEQGGSPFFLGHTGFEEQKMLHRSEKGGAKEEIKYFSITGIHGITVHVL